MHAFKQRVDPLKLLGRRAILLVVLLASVFAAVRVWDVYWKERESGSLRMQAEAKLADLQERQEKLAEDIARLKTERGVEEILREQYQLAKSGEGLIIIVEPPAPKPVQRGSVADWFREIFSR